MVRKRIQEVIFGNYQMNYLIEFDLYILYFKGWCEKIVKTGDTQKGITKKIK